MKTLKAVLVLTMIGFLSACSSLTSDAGCVTYGAQRAQMPTLGTDPVSEWVDVTDGAMTGACTGDTSILDRLRGR